MLERVPEALTQQFVGALKRYREVIAEGVYDNNVLVDLQVVLLRLSPTKDKSSRDQTFERLFEGTYGTCMKCHEEIPIPRLIAMPLLAKLCRNCQEAAEKSATTSTAQPKVMRYQDPELNRAKRQDVHIIDPPRQLPKHLSA